MGKTFTLSTKLQCPHGGTVAVVPSNTRVQADDLLVTADDTWTVTGCSNSPQCTKVEWSTPDARVTVGGSATLSDTAIGACVSAAGPQGPPAVQQNQSIVSSS